MGLEFLRRAGRFWVMRALVMLAFAAGALVPAGFMPARAADGTIVVVLCSSTGPVGIAQPEDVARPTVAITIPSKKPAPGSADPSPCAYAAHAAPAALPERLPVAVADTVAPAPVAPLALVALRPGRGMSAPPPPSHAPPVPSA